MKRVQPTPSPITSASADVPVPTIPDAPAAFHLLAKPTGAVCNLDCSYCFFLSKEMLYPGARFRMADELLEAYLRQLIEAHAAGAGGDGRLAGRRADADGPRLLPPFGRARRALPRPRPARRLHHPDERDAARRRSGRPSSRSTTSWSGSRSTARASCMTRTASTRAARVLRPGHARARAPARGRRGVERAHDRPRRERRPRPRGLPLPAGRVRRALRPVHPDHRAGRGGCRRRHRPVDLLARPAALRPGGKPGHRPIGHRRAVRALPHRRLRGVGAARRRRGVRADVRRRARELGRRAAEPVRPLRDLRARARARAHGRPLLLRPLRRARATSSATSRSATCSSWLPRSSSGSSGSTSATRCRATACECDVRFACHGGCPKDRFIETPDGEPGLNYLCAGFKDFFHHIDRPMRFMSEQLQRGRAPAEIMRAVRGRGCAARPQRALHVRLRPQVEAVPRHLRACRPASRARSPSPASARLHFLTSPCAKGKRALAES